MKHRKIRKSIANRRGFLKTAALGSFTSLSLVRPSLAKEHNQQYSRMVKGSLTDPIRPIEIEDIQKRIIRRYFKNSGENQGIARSVPEFSDSIVIVAFHYTIDNAGIPRQYVGAVPVDDETKRRDVEKRHQEAEDHASRFSSFRSSSMTTTASSGGYSVDPAWNEVDDNRVTVGRCKEGKYTKTCKSYEHEEDNDNVFACTSTVQMIPSLNIADCTSIWENDRLHVDHDWGANSIGLATQDEHDPSGPHTGGLTGISAGVSYIGANIGWSFSQPDVTRRDDSNTQHAEWSFDWNDNHEDTFVFRLGSKCYFDAEEQKNDKILVIDTDGTFRGLTSCSNYGCSYSYETFSHNTHLYWAGSGGAV